MQLVRPKVFVLAKTELFEPDQDPMARIDVAGVQEYLGEIGADTWGTDTMEGALVLCEMAGRTCYNSFVPGLNPNVTKVREGNVKYLENILKERHGSVFEHASITFAFTNVSRVLTHELVRHRVGVAISQQSGRYVRLIDIPMVLPEVFTSDAMAMAKIEEILDSIENFQVWAAAHWKLDEPETKFSTKKAITSAMRRVAPDGRGTIIIWTTNLRTLRHVLATRTSIGAEWEIRYAFNKVGNIAKTLFPAAFQDFTVTEEGEWQPKYDKV